MNWNSEMSVAYQTGYQDGLSGHRRGRPNDFETCYEQGWQDGKGARVTTIMRRWNKATETMREILKNKNM